MKSRGQITLAALLGGLSLVGSIFGVSSFFGNKVDATNTRVSAVEGDIKAIKQDISWIRSALERQPAFRSIASSSQN